MASLHSSFLLTSNFLSLTTPSSFPTHILFPVRLSTTHLRPLLLTTRHGFGRSPFAAVAEQAATATEAAVRRLYAGNIPRTVTNNELAKIVQEHGVVEKAEALIEPDYGSGCQCSEKKVADIERGSIRATILI